MFGRKATTATDITIASGFSDTSQKFQERALEDAKKKMQAAIDQAKVCFKLKLKKKKIQKLYKLFGLLSNAYCSYCFGPVRLPELN